MWRLEMCLEQEFCWSRSGWGMFKELGPEQGGWDSKREHSDERNI